MVRSVALHNGCRWGVTKGTVRGRSVEATRVPVKCFLMLLLLRHAMLHYGPANNLHKANSGKKSGYGARTDSELKRGTNGEITETLECNGRLTDVLMFLLFNL